MKMQEFQALEGCISDRTDGRSYFHTFRMMRVRAKDQNASSPLVRVRKPNRDGFK